MSKAKRFQLKTGGEYGLTVYMVWDTLLCRSLETTTERDYAQRRVNTLNGTLDSQSELCADYDRFLRHEIARKR